MHLTCVFKVFEELAFNYRIFKVITNRCFCQRTTVLREIEDIDREREIDIKYNLFSLLFCSFYESDQQLSN